MMFSCDTSFSSRDKEIQTDEKERALLAKGDNRVGRHCLCVSRPNVKNRFLLGLTFCLKHEDRSRLE